MSSAPENNISLVLVRGEPLRTNDLSVQRPSMAMAAMEKVIERAKAIKSVNSPASQAKASLVAKELKGLLTGVEVSYRYAKTPILAIGRALDHLNNELVMPLQEQYQRMDRLVSAYQDELRREHELAEAKIKAAAEEAERAMKRKIQELEKQKEQLELKARLTQDLLERRDAQKEANRVETKIQGEQLGLQISRETLPMAPMDPTPKPPGGRGWTKYTVEIEDEKIVYETLRQLLKVELRQGAAQEFAKALDEAGKPLVVPGLRIYKNTRTSFQGAAAIRVHDQDEQ